MIAFVLVELARGALRVGALKAIELAIKKWSARHV